MAQGNSNLILQLLITAKDDASAAFGKLFSYLDDNTKVIAGKIREAFTGLFGGGLASASDFEAQLDRVAAKGGYTGEELETLKEQARLLGAQFGITGTEAAQGLEALAAAGLSATDAIKTLPQVLALAASEQISADAAAQKLIDSLSIMGLGFEEAGRMADVLAKGANITTSSASQLAEALSMAGGTAKAAGMDLEYTVAALDLLHKNGIKGSEAGTALRAILTALLDPASKASQELDALGITSRDLGTVLAQLQTKGGAASGAILAFGQEAGPGLRALISEGQAGLNDYTAQLKNAEGAAQQAADEMGGNLKSALATLSSAWDSLKSALLDPLLEPITKQVKDLAGAFQEGLSSDKFKAVQDTIKDFGEQAAKAISEFVKSFDFQQAFADLADFVSQAKGHFEVVGQAGTVAANAVKLAWNGVTMAVQAVAAILAGFGATFTTTAETIFMAMNQVGLVSDETAQKVSAFAEQSRTWVTQLRDGIVTDAGDMANAWQGMTQATDNAAAANEALKTSVPTAEIQALTYTLKDYEAIAARANAAAQQARVDLDAGKLSAQEYGQKILEAAEANAALEAAQKAETEASQQATASIEEQIKALQTTVQEAGSYAKAVEGLVAAQNAGLRAEIALAEAKGNTAEVQRLSRQLAIQEAEGALRVAEAKWAEQQAEAALAIKKLEQLNAIKDKNAEIRQQIELAVVVAQKELAEAQAAGVNTQAQQALLEKLQQVNAAKGGAVPPTQQNTEATQQNTEATQQNTEAQAANVKVVSQAGEVAKRLADAYHQGKAAAEELSEATGVLYDKLFYGWSQGDALVYSNAVANWLLELDAVEGKYAELEAEIAKMTATAEFAAEKMMFASSNIGASMAATLRFSAEARKAFYEQQLAAEKLADRYEQWAETGVTGMADMEGAMYDLQRATDVEIASMNLLDDEDLSRLRAAIDDAKEKLREMQEETQSAKDRLTEMNAELLEARGLDQKAELLRQQLDYQQQLADIERQREAVSLTGNQELISVLDQQRSVLEQINQQKIANIQRTEEEGAQADRTAQRVRDTADQAERLNKAMGGLAQQSLANLNQQADALHQSLSAVNKLL